MKRITSTPHQSQNRGDLSGTRGSPSIQLVLQRSQRIGKGTAHAHKPSVLQDQGTQVGSIQGGVGGKGLKVLANGMCEVDGVLQLHQAGEGFLVAAEQPGIEQYAQGLTLRPYEGRAICSHAEVLQMKGRGPKRNFSLQTLSLSLQTDGQNCSRFKTQEACFQLDRGFLRTWPRSRCSALG